MMTPAETRGYVAACRLFAHVGAELAAAAPNVTPPQNARSHFADELRITSQSIIETAAQVLAAGTGLSPERMDEILAADILANGHIAGGAT